MDEYAGIEFRPGPAGLRPGLVDGPDVWEVVAVFRSFDDTQQTADWLDQPVGSIEAALRYYDEHRNDIDDWIRLNDDEVARRAGPFRT